MLQKNIGLGNQITIKLARLDKSDSKGAQCLAIRTDGQVTLELPSIRAGTDILQCKCSSVSPLFFLSERVLSVCYYCRQCSVFHPDCRLCQYPRMAVFLTTFFKCVIQP